jgi:hypothetical protein
MESMDGGAISLLYCPNGAFYLPHMSVCSIKVNVDGKYVLSNAFELVVTMQIGDDETMGLVETEKAFKMFGHCSFCLIRHSVHNTLLYLL